MAASGAALAAFRSAWSEPERLSVGTSYATRLRNFEEWWGLYTSTLLDDAARSRQYATDHRLYRATRLLYNPTRRLVETYVALVYPGVLSEDGSRLPDGVPLAIPLAEDTPPALRGAIAQLWQWSNWQSEKAVLVRYGAAMGSVLVEITDDLDRGKVAFDVVPPPYVTDLTLDAAGNVKAYAISKRVYEEDTGAFYTYSKLVDQDSIRAYRDAEQTSDEANPYPFVPAIWIRHKHVGLDHGAPAIDGSLGKIRELNSIASQLQDGIGKKLAAPVIFWADAGVRTLADAAKRTSSDDFSADDADREAMLVLRGPSGGRSESLATGQGLADAMPYVESLLREIEADKPEMTLWRELRAMSSLTGPAAARVMGDAAANVYEAQANYDRGLVALFQMAVAIAGWRLSSGAWGPAPTRQQRRFDGFDLASYERGDLDLAILPRPLVAQTSKERAEEAFIRSQATYQWAQAGLPPEALLAHDFGWDDAALATLAAMQPTPPTPTPPVTPAANGAAGNVTRGTQRAQGGPNATQGQ